MHLEACVEFLWKSHAHHTRCWIYNAKGGDLTSISVIFSVNAHL